MPRKKKNGQSPARVPGLSNEGTSSNPAGYISYGGEMASNFLPDSALSSSDKENIVSSMREMFSHLDPEVIYIVLSECDFKVENAMDSLLELSVAAEDAAPLSPGGFERTAAALLSPQHSSSSLDLRQSGLSPSTLLPPPEPNARQDPSELSPSPTFPLTDELDLLIDQELESLATRYEAKEEPTGSQYVSAPASLSSLLLPPPPIPQQRLPEVFPSGHGCGGEAVRGLLDFSHLTSERPASAPHPSLTLGVSGRPSAFQAYKKEYRPGTLPERSTTMSCGGVVGGARSKLSAAPWDPPSGALSPWNPEAPAFVPRSSQGGPAFITPVVPSSPSTWYRHGRPASHWMSQGPVGHGPPRLPAALAKAWSLPTAPQPSRLQLEGKVLVLLRGAPGSGKSTLARAMLEHNPGGVILSTDDYFCQLGEYRFEPTALGEAHEWNHKRAKKAFETGISPIIIDNTNMQGWEMKPYVAQALMHKYKVMFRDPDTWWKHKPRELVKRTKHGVVADRIRRMLDGYEHCVSVQSIMGSQMPEWKQLQQEVNRVSQPVSSDTPHPDLVGESRQTKEFDTSGINLFSSLPDVSLIKPSGAIRTPENRGSTECRPPSGTAHEVLRVPSEGDDTDPGDVVSELDAQREALDPSGGQGFPDCIVESVLSEDRRDDELPVAFSESIAQRVRRERPSRRSDFDSREPADLVRNTDRSEREAESSKGVDGGHTQTGRPELLDFLGDWPSEGRLDQRQARQRQRQGERHAEDQGENAKAADRRNRQPEARLASGVAEFQKLLDLIQTYPSVDGAHAGSPAGLPRSPSSDEECGMEGMEVGESQDAHGDQANAAGRGSARADLPDCVQDWKASLSSAVRPSPNANDAETSTTEGYAHVLDGDRETGPLSCESVNLCDSLANLSGDSPVTSESGVADVGHDVADGHVEGTEACTEVAFGQAEKDMQSCTTQHSLIEDFSEPDGSHIGEVSVSPVCEGSLEAESASLGGGAQDRKRQGRRSGKQCKLALTFTQNCRSSSPKDLKDRPSATAQNQSSSPFSVQSDVDLNSTPESALGLKTNLHLCPDLRDSPSPESKLQPSSPILITDTRYSTQTNPQDFALLWRLSAPGVIMGSHPDDITVLSGNPSRFRPEVPHALSAVHPAGHREVPYHVVYEKGTQVEEKELGGASSRLESLRILSRHFKLVSFDTLEDLYDKCQQDLDWTTNLLLDSGERFFREEDVEDESAAWSGDDQNSNVTPGAFGLAQGIGLYSGKVVDQTAPPAGVEVNQESASVDSSGRAFKQLGEGYDTFPWSSGQMSEEKGDQGLTEWDPGHLGDEMTPEFSQNPVYKSSPQPPQSMLGEMTAERREDVEKDTTLEPLVPGSELPGGTSDDERLSEVLKAELGVVEMSCMDEATQLILAELEEIQRGESVQHKEASIAQRNWEEGRSKHLNIQSVELKLPTELALQLTELFGPVGIDPGACSAEEYEVQMDLNLARLLHQKWKDTIQERQRQAALSYHLLQESSVHWGESQEDISGSREGPAHFLIGADGYASLDGQPETQDDMPFMDHWNVSHHQVSLRDIMTEEQARQENMEKTRQSRADLDRRDGAVLLKEYQLYSLFPTIDRHFLLDIFRDHNYCLQETEQFLRSLLDEGPVKTVVAPELPPSDLHRASSKDREKQRQRPAEPSLSTTYQDTEDPEYQDFRAEASLQKARQLECFAKAAEAYRQGRKDVASFYAQQGHLHSDRMHGANQRAAAQIFERVNSSLLPRNILDLHGLHVDEALQHLAQVLLDKTTEYQQGSCQPQLSVITGRGNHSQGGVARIRPAVIDYLANKHYKFTEPKPGLVLVSLC